MLIKNSGTIFRDRPIPYTMTYEDIASNISQIGPLDKTPNARVRFLYNRNGVRLWFVIDRPKDVVLTNNAFSRAWIAVREAKKLTNPNYQMVPHAQVQTKKAK